MSEEIKCVENIGSYRWSPLSNRKLEYIKWSSGVPEDLHKWRKDDWSFYDREIDKVILLFFQSGAGGLFLANCLSLSSSVCSFLSKTNKIKLWEQYLDTQGTFWNDLYLNNIAPEVCTWHQTRKNYVTDGYFFIYDHEHENIPTHYDFWFNPKMIYFKNADLFCKIRKVLKNIDGEIACASYEPLLPELKEYPIPKSFSEFFSLPIEKQNELKNVYSREMDKIFDSGPYMRNGRSFYIWDTNWFFSQKQTVLHIKELYDLYGFTDFDEEVISRLYRKWMVKLDSKCRETRSHMKNIPKFLSELTDPTNFDTCIWGFECLPDRREIRRKRNRPPLK